MKTERLLLAVALVGWQPCEAAKVITMPSNATTQAVAKAVETLSKTAVFAFGGVGIAGITSEGEAAFRVIVGFGNADANLRSVFDKGTPAAKLYALAGLQSLDKLTYTRLAEALKKDSPSVRTMAGCILQEERASAIIKRIEAGDYAGYLLSTTAQEDNRHDLNPDTDRKPQTK